MLRDKLLFGCILASLGINTGVVSVLGYSRLMEGHSETAAAKRLRPIAIGLYKPPARARVAPQATPKPDSSRLGTASAAKNNANRLAAGDWKGKSILMYTPQTRAGAASSPAQGGPNGTSQTGSAGMSTHAGAGSSSDGAGNASTADNAARANGDGAGDGAGGSDGGANGGRSTNGASGAGGQSGGGDSRSGGAQGEGLAAGSQSPDAPSRRSAFGASSGGVSDARRAANGGRADASRNGRSDDAAGKRDGTSVGGASGESGARNAANGRAGGRENGAAGASKASRAARAGGAGESAGAAGQAANGARRAATQALAGAAMAGFQKPAGTKTEASAQRSARGGKGRGTRAQGSKIDAPARDAASFEEADDAASDKTKDDGSSEGARDAAQRLARAGGRDTRAADAADDAANDDAGATDLKAGAALEIAKKAQPPSKATKYVMPKIAKMWTVPADQKLILPENLILDLPPDMPVVAGGKALTREQIEQLRKMLHGQNQKHMKGLTREQLKKMLAARKDTERPAPGDSGGSGATDTSRERPHDDTKKAERLKPKQPRTVRVPREQMASLPPGLTSPFRYKPWSPAWRARYAPIIKQAETQRMVGTRNAENTKSKGMTSNAKNDAKPGAAQGDKTRISALPQNSNNASRNAANNAQNANAQNDATNGAQANGAQAQGNTPAAAVLPDNGSTNNGAQNGRNTLLDGTPASLDGMTGQTPTDPTGNNANGVSGQANANRPGSVLGGEQGQAAGALPNAGGEAQNGALPANPAGGEQTDNRNNGQAGAQDGGMLNGGSTEGAQAGNAAVGGASAAGGTSAGAAPSGAQDGNRNGQNGGVLGGGVGSGAVGGGAANPVNGGAQAGNPQQNGNGQQPGNPNGGNAQGGGMLGGGNAGATGGADAGNPNAGSQNGAQGGMLGGQNGSGAGNAIGNGSQDNGAGARNGQAGGMLGGGQGGAGQNGNAPTGGGQAGNNQNGQGGGMLGGGAGGQGGMLGGGAGGQGGAAGGGNNGGQGGNGGPQGGMLGGGAGGQNGNGGQGGMLGGGQGGAGGQGGPQGGGQGGMLGGGAGGQGGAGAQGGAQGAGGAQGGGGSGGAGDQGGGQQGGLIGGDQGGQQGGQQGGMIGAGGASGGGGSAGGSGGGGMLSGGGQGGEGGTFDGAMEGGGMIDLDNPAGEVADIAGESNSEDTGYTPAQGVQPNMPEHNRESQKGLPGALVLPPLPPMGVEKGTNPLPQPVKPSRRAAKPLRVVLIPTPRATAPAPRPRAGRPAIAPRAQEQKPPVLVAPPLQTPPLVASQKRAQSAVPPADLPPALSVGSLSTHGTVDVAVTARRRLPLGAVTELVNPPAKPDMRDTRRAPQGRRLAPRSAVAGAATRDVASPSPIARRAQKRDAAQAPETAKNGPRQDGEALPARRGQSAQSEIRGKAAERQSGAAFFALLEQLQASREKADTAQEKKANNSKGVKEGTKNPLPPTPLPDSDAEIGDGSGLKGEYYLGRNFDQYQFTRADPNLDLFWGGDNSPSPKLPVGTDWTIRWTGKIEPRFSEDYTIYAVADDGVRLWIDHKLIIDAWTLHPLLEYEGKFTFKAGKQYDIRVDYFEGAGPPAMVGIYWESASQVKEFVPEERLFYPLAGDKAELEKDEPPHR